MFPASVGVTRVTVDDCGRAWLLTGLVLPCLDRTVADDCPCGMLSDGRWAMEARKSRQAGELQAEARWRIEDANERGRGAFGAERQGLFSEFGRLGEMLIPGWPRVGAEAAAALGNDTVVSTAPAQGNTGNHGERLAAAKPLWVVGDAAAPRRARGQSARRNLSELTTIEQPLPELSRDSTSLAGDEGLG